MLGYHLCGYCGKRFDEYAKLRRMVPRPFPPEVDITDTFIEENVETEEYPGCPYCHRGKP